MPVTLEHVKVFTSELTQSILSNQILDTLHANQYDYDGR